jgi:hydroxyacyl-ACP dehydratase HTD2-like protein with hotdog domain
MAGGLDIAYHKPIKPGDWLTAARTLTDIYEKSGRSGPLIFYEVLMEVRNDEGALVVSERTTRILR